MRGVLLDTNAYGALLKGHTGVARLVQHADIVGMSVVVLGELIAGFSIGSKHKKNLSELNSFLEVSRVNVFPVDETTVSFYAKIYSSLREKGKPIPTNDLWIAATTLQQGFKLCTFDKHFHFVENLVIATTVEEFLL